MRDTNKNYSRALEDAISSDEWLYGEHEKLAVEKLPEPLNYLISELVLLNQKKWLSDDLRRTYGADRIKQYGITENQYRWLRDVLKDVDSDEESDEGEQ